MKLTENMRVAKIAAMDPSPERYERLQEYSNWLLDLGEGKKIFCVTKTSSRFQIIWYATHQK